MLLEDASRSKAVSCIMQVGHRSGLCISFARPVIHGSCHTENTVPEDHMPITPPTLLIADKFLALVGARPIGWMIFWITSTCTDRTVLCMQWRWLLSAGQLVTHTGLAWPEQALLLLQLGSRAKLGQLVPLTSRAAIVTGSAASSNKAGVTCRRSRQKAH